MNAFGYIETARVVRAARWVGLLLAVLSACRAVVLFRMPERPGLLQSPLFYLVVAAAVFGAVTLAWIPLAAGKIALPTRRWVQAAALTCGGGALLAYTFDLLPQWMVIGGWLLAQPLWVAAYLPDWTRPRRPPPDTLAEAAGLGGILVVAAALRLYHIGSLPVNFNGDFAGFGLQARALLAGNYKDFFETGYAGFPLPGVWPTAILMRLFGDNLIGLAAFACLGGLASLIALYLLTRELFGWRPALFATALLAGDLVHIHYSRVASYMDPVPFLAWSVCLGVLGMRRGGRWRFALSGILAGHAFLSYYPGRMVLPLAALGVALTAMVAPSVFRARSRGLAIGLVGFLIVVGPVVVFFARNPEIVNARARQVLLSDPGAWRHTASKYGLADSDIVAVMREQIKRSAESFWRFGDSAAQFGIQRNSLAPIAGILLILGLGYAVWHPGRPALLFVLGWGLGYVVAGALTGDPPFSGRMVGLTLPAAVLCGVALDRALRLLPRGREWGKIALVVGLAVTVESGLRNWHDYVAWGTDPHTALPEVHVGRFLMTQPRKYEVRLASRGFGWKLREHEFMLPDRKGEWLAPDVIASGSIVWPQSPTIFILMPEYRSFAETLQRRYPNGRLVDGSIPPMKGVFSAFFTE